MIILGNKYQITKDEHSKIKQEINNIHNIDILNDDKNIIDSLKIFLAKQEIEFVVLNLEKDLSIRVKSYLEELDYGGMKIMLFSEFAKQFLDREFIEFNEQNLKTLQSIQHNEFKKTSKRIFDIIFSLVALISLAPIFLIIAILIKIKSPNGPIVFTQQRFGMNKTFFRVLKFRTMIPNAEKALQEMMLKDIELKNEYLKYRKLRNDPRIIAGIGNFLRKSSLDELPQFFNILIGDMSVVGPRPYIENEFYSHDDKFLDVILSTKPGITGPWQVGQRNNTTFNQRVLEDVKYVSIQSFMLDIKIILETIKVMIFKKGAY